MNLIQYAPYENEFFDRFAEMLTDAELTYCCNDLRKTGINDESDMATAIFRSIQALQQAGLAPREHFKHIFVTNIQTGTTYNDWRISKTGFLLVLMNSSGKSDQLNRWKIEMVNLLK